MNEPQSAQNPFLTPTDAFADASSQGISADARLNEILRSTKRWVRVVSVAGAIFVGLMVLGSLIAIGVSAFGGAGSAQTIGIAVVYLAMAAIYGMPIVFLYRYASWIQRYLQSQRQHDLVEALSNQKSFWKFMGVFFLIVIGMYLLMILVVAVGFGVGAM